jgi:light-regulated signal transduction histidine kinase (bacteriophytochrome)
LSWSRQESSGATAALERVRHITRRIEDTPTLADACHAATQQVREITGFERVMVYRFLEDDSGSVIAESRARQAVAYFNHRFPAADIPPQARELYRHNLIRTIPDVAYKPSPIQPGSDPEPVDMSQCLLRSVSPIHIQYLKNMDVGASMSISLLVNGDLWGLIACHHDRSRAVPVAAQLLCRHAGMVVDDNRFSGNRPQSLSPRRQAGAIFVSRLPECLKSDRVILVGYPRRHNKLLSLSSFWT